MATRPFTDAALTCAACGDNFVFTAGEQELQTLRGLAQQRPHHCSRCRRSPFRLGRPIADHAHATGAPHPSDSRGADFQRLQK